MIFKLLCTLPVIARWLLCTTKQCIDISNIRMFEFLLLYMYICTWTHIRQTKPERKRQLDNETEQLLMPGEQVKNFLQYIEMHSNDGHYEVVAFVCAYMIRSNKAHIYGPNNDSTSRQLGPSVTAHSPTIATDDVQSPFPLPSHLQHVTPRTQCYCEWSWCAGIHTHAHNQQCVLCMLWFSVTCVEHMYCTRES